MIFTFKLLCGKIDGEKNVLLESLCCTYDSDIDLKWYAVYDSLPCRKLIIELEDTTTEEEEERFLR